MPRLRPARDDELTRTSRELIALAEQTRAPDPRMLRILLRNPEVMEPWVQFWNAIFYGGHLPHTLKEMVRVKLSWLHACGY